MQRDHRYPYGRGPRRGIYDRLGPPPLPLADQALGRPGAAPHRVPQPESAYPTPYRQQPVNEPVIQRLTPPPLMMIPTHHKQLNRSQPSDWARQPPPPHQLKAFIDNRKRMLNEFLKGPPSVQSGAGWRGRDAVLGQERSHVSKEMARSVSSLFEPEYHSDVPQSNPECRPLAAAVPSVDGGLSDNLRFVSDYVRGKMDTASPLGEEREVAHSAVTEGPYRHDPQPDPRTMESYLGLHGASRIGPAPPSFMHQHHQRGEDELHRSVRSTDDAQGRQPPLEEVLHIDEGISRPYFERRMVRPDATWKRGFDCSPTKGAAVQTRSPGWQGQSWRSHHVEGSPNSDMADAMTHGSIESRLEPLNADPVIIRETQPRSIGQPVHRELHPPPQAPSDRGSPSVMRHQPESFHVRPMPLPHRETQESVPTSWEKMPLDDVVQMEEKMSRSPAYQREEQGKGKEGRFPITGLPPHLSVVPMELDSGSQSEDESGARGVGLDSPLPHAVRSPLHTNRLVKDPICANSLPATTDGQESTGSFLTALADVQRESATEPTEGSSGGHSSRPEPPRTPNESLVVGISDLGLATRLVPVTAGLPREALHNMYAWAKRQVDRNITKKAFNNAHSIEVDVRTHVRLLDWIESNKMQLSHPVSINKVESRKNQFRDEVRKDIKLILSSVVENLAIEELVFLMNTCPPQLFLSNTASYSETLDCQLILKKAGYLCSREDEQRVKSLFAKSRKVKMILRRAKMKGKSVAAALREYSESGEAAQQNRGKNDSLGASVGKKHPSEDTVASIEGRPAVAAGSVPVSEGSGQVAGCSASATEDQEMVSVESTSVVGRGPTSGHTGPTEGQELPIEDRTFIEQVVAGAVSGGSCGHDVRSDIGENYSSTNNPERLPVLLRHDDISDNALVSENPSCIDIPNDALARPDSKEVELTGRIGANSGELGTMKQPPSVLGDHESSVIGTRQISRNSSSVKMGHIAFARPEFTEIGLSRVKRVSKEGVTPTILNHFRKWVRSEFQALYLLKSFSSVHSMEISIRTAVKWLEWYHSHGSTGNVQTLENQRLALHRMVRNEFRGMLLIVKENVAIEEAKAVKGNQQVMQSVLSGSYQRKLCWNDLVQRMGYVVPRAEEGDKKAQDLLKKVDQVRLLIESLQRGSNNAKTVESDASNRQQQSESLDLPTLAEQHKWSGNTRHSRSKSNTSTSSEADSSPDSSRKKKKMLEQRRSGHWRSRNRSSNSPRRSRSRQTSRCRESSYDASTCGNASSSAVRASRSLQKRSKSCERSYARGITPSSDSETEKMRQKYADEEDIKLLEMRRKLLQSILDKQQKGRELAKLPVQTKSVAPCSPLPKSASSNPAQTDSSVVTQKSFVMLSSSLVEANMEVSAPTEEPPLKRSAQPQIAKLDHPPVECEASVKGAAFDYISDEEDTQNIDTALQEESTTVCGKVGRVLLPSNSTVGYTKEGGPSPVHAGSQVLKMVVVRQREELEEGEVVSSEDEAPLVIDYLEEGACIGESAERKQVIAKSSHGSLMTSSVLATRETANGETTPVAGESVRVCEIARPDSTETRTVTELIKKQEDANAKSEEKLEECVSASYSCLTEWDRPGGDVVATENAAEMKDPSAVPMEHHKEEADSRQANVGSSTDTFQCDDAPPAVGSGYTKPSVSAVPSIEVSLDAFIAQSKINSLLVRKAFHSSVVREEDSGFAAETISQQSRGVGRQVSGPTNLASAKFALGQKDSWKQTSNFIITVTEETTSGSEDSEDEMVTPPSPPPPALLGKMTFDGIPPPVMPPLPITDLGLPISIDFKPRSILVSGSGHSASSAGTGKAPPGTSVSKSVSTSGVLPPAESVPESNVGNLSQEDPVAVEATAPAKVGNSIKSSSLRLPLRRGTRAQGSVGSGDHMEVGASGGKGKEPVVKQGRKREPSTSDDGSLPAVKRRAVSVNAVAVQAEVKSPVKMHWKQVEHEVQEARRQLTRIRAKKCLQSVHAMEADTTKQRAEVKQEQQRLNLLTQQLTSSTQEASELEMKVELLKNQLAQAKETLKTKQNRIGRLQKEVKATMTSLSGKKETLNKQSELLNEEKQKLRNFRDVLKSGAFASVKAGAKSIVPLRKRTSSVEGIVPETAQLEGKEREKTSGVNEADVKVEVTTSTAAAPVQSCVCSPTDALATPSVSATSEGTAHSSITDPQAKAPVATSALEMPTVHIDATDSSPVTSNPVVAGHTEEAANFTGTTQTLEKGPQTPSLQPPPSPPQPVPHLTSLPSPNTVKRSQPIIALEKLPEDAIRREKEKEEEGEGEEEEEEEEEGALNVKHPHCQVFKEPADEADGASTVTKLTSQHDFSKKSQTEAPVGPSHPRAHSRRLEMIVKRLRGQARMGATFSGWFHPHVEVVEDVDGEGDMPRLLQVQEMQDKPTDALQAGDDPRIALEVAKEMEEASLECTSEGEQGEEGSSPLTHADLMCWEGKERASQPSQVEPSYAGLPCIHLSHNGIVLLSERLGHLSNSGGYETRPRLPHKIVQQLTRKSQGAPASGFLSHTTNSSTDVCGDNSDRSAPSGRGLQKYSSPLLCLRRYIASPQFWRHHPYRLKSDTFMSRINPKQVMCRYGLQGVCRDSSCDKQHWKDVTDASSRHVMEELALLHPEVCGIDVRYLKAKLGPKYSSTLKKLVDKYISSHIQQVQQKEGDPLLEFLHKIRSSVHTSGGIHFITSSHLSTNSGSSSSTVAHDNSDVTLYLDQLQPPPREVEEEARLDVQQVFGGPLAITSVRDPEQLSAQEGRYFARSKVMQIGEMEKYLEEHPHDVEAWLSFVEEVGKSFSDEKARVTAAIKTVERSLQNNPSSVRVLCRHIQLLHMRSGRDVAAVDRAVSEAVLTTGKEVPAAAVILEHAWAHELPSDKKCVCLNFIPLVLEHKCKEVGSSDAVELMMVAAQVDIVLRHPERAVTAVKSFLSDHSSSLTPSHCVFAWLCYVSISRLGQLPSSLFTHRDYLDTKQPLRLLSKEPFVMCFGDWFAQTAQLGQKQRPSAMSGSPHSTPVPQPTSSNLESLHQQWMESFSEALSSCMENMAGLSAEETQRTLQPLWLSIAAVEEVCGYTEECVAGLKLMVEASGGRHAFIKGYQTLLAAVDADNASQILASAFALHERSPQMCYMTAKHAALHSNTDGALQCLVALVEEFVEQPCSEAVQPHTAALIYRKLLGQYVPGDQLASLPPLADDRPPREEVGHLWLCYCLLAELLPSSLDNTGKERFTDPVDVFEAAVHSQTNSPDRKLVWKEYLKFLRDKASGEGASLQNFKSFTSCTQRCLLAVDHKEIVAEENSDCFLQVDDYMFHNEVVEMHVSLLPDQDQPVAYRQWMKILPNSDCVIAKAALMAVRQSHSNIKWVQGWLASYLEEHSKSVAVWKIAIKLECSLKRYKEARWMFQEALKNVPLSGSLWKEYVMFEVDQMKDASGNAAKQLPEGVAELFKNAAQNGIRISDVMQPFMHPAPHKSIPA